MVEKNVQYQAKTKFKKEQIWKADKKIFSDNFQKTLRK